ncbi:MAG: hypothetical protein IKC80_04090 [Kiritimatiellae bacterium]|nr:hypothetical protein [Kiritimatiellia bacterium]
MFQVRPVSAALRKPDRKLRRDDRVRSMMMPIVFTFIWIFFFLIGADIIVQIVMYGNIVACKVTKLLLDFLPLLQLYVRNFDIICSNVHKKEGAQREKYIGSLPCSGKVCRSNIAADAVLRQCGYGAVGKQDRACRCKMG